MVKMVNITEINSRYYNIEKNKKKIGCIRKNAWDRWLVFSIITGLSYTFNYFEKAKKYVLKNY